MICLTSLFEQSSIKTLFFNNQIICENCQKQIKKINKTQYVDGVQVWFLYEYNSFMKNLIYQFKGCYDVALKDFFLYEFKGKIKRKYKDYFIVFPPSNTSDDIKRKYNHINKIIESLKMKNDYLFYKDKEFKQSSQLYIDRKNIESVIKLKNNKYIDPKQKYLIIDDIYTSGSTLKTIIKLLVNNNVKKENISAIIIAKTADFVEF